MKKIAKFNIGDVVIHKKQGYRAVIIDADPLFQASGQYNPQADKREFACKAPWYRLLVDESSLSTYVEEDLLLRDDSKQAVNNPNVSVYLITIKDGYYTSSYKPH
ncbi:MULTISPECIES: heat shock protein HspQ [Legionella]|uniref:Heat shock protein HspQ n=1 Tax=Legionella septentrionalis TaxID=2498109 RepID=A0A433JG89_9GAMM|nr:MULTISPECIES: heat shock protein HspQ [Legionella]MCP0915002.1 heat shock protein HspQ [Legionella sp. 27cVA30]RUQ78591.1 heat shock protein HspQ [Legionella septentrionalis]RUQ95631.1 heat shock protein HspQ [Legionella septentrionalis]RUR09556.1 heat shock protein HspQ [Legionella septentrionalis]RUR12139.1 heat shock protein HspQ [Legionella septentrionalis]